jgi:hypothetical protein
MDQQRGGRGRSSRGGGGGRGRGRSRGGGWNGNSASNQNDASSGGPARKQLRSLERLLARGSLPDDVRTAKEAELAALRGDVQKQSRVAREKHFSKKYHGVKFIERRKVERRIAQLERRIAEQRASDGAVPAAVEAELREAQHDLLYITHFPRSKK